MKKITVSKLRDKIKSLNRLNIEKADYKYIKKTISEMHNGLTTLIVNSSLSHSIYRVRLCPPKKPQKLNELKAPPSTAVINFQRCNSPNNPMFYASSKRATALLECDVQVGDIVYISQWRVDKRFALNYVFLNDPHEKNGIECKHTPVEEMLLAYFDTVFTRPIHKVYSNQYKITSAITEQLTRNFKKEENDNIHIHPDGYVGLYYPSVVDIERGYNIALHPKIVDRCLTLAHVMEAKITSRDDLSVTIEVTDNSNTIDNDDIVWSGDPNKIPLNRIGNSTVYIHEDGKWQLGVRTMSSSEDLKELLEE